MKRKQWWKHAAAIIAGLSLAFVWPSSGDRDKSGSSEPSSAEDSSARISRESRGSKSTKNSARNDLKREYAKAWEQMIHEKDQTYQAYLQRKSLLEDWAEVDLKSALAASLDFSESRLGGSQWNSFDHLEAFDEVIRRRPIEFFDLLRGDPFGLVTGRARQHWISEVAKNEPGLIPGILDQLGNRDKVTALQGCLDSGNLSEERKHELIFSLAALPDVPENRGLLDVAGKQLAQWSDSQLLARYEAASDAGTRRILESAFHARLLDGGGDREAMRQRLESMPAGIAEAVLQRTLAEPRQNAAAFTLALDGVLETPEWATREKDLCMKLHNLHQRGANPDELAKWAESIPERGDCEDLYRVAMRGLLGGDREKAWRFLGQMPPGWKRDNAYLEYVNRAVHVLSDEAAAARAVGQMESDHFRAQADEMISKWRAKRNP